MKETQSATRASRSFRKKVLVVDDHPIFRAGLATLLQHEQDLKVCGEAEDAAQAMAAVEKLNPDIVLLDVGLHGNSGLDLLKNMHAVRPELPVLAISMHDEMLFAERVLRAGGRGYLMKHAGLDLLLLAIRKVLAGGIYLSDRASGNILTSLAGRQDKAQGSDRISCLTDREFEIFRLMGQGLEPHAVAAQLHISVKTIDTHRSHIREKLGLKNSTELIHFATRWLNEQR